MTEAAFEHIRPLDFLALETLNPTERFQQRLLDHDSGARTCSISYIRTPVGGGSPAGLHVHDVDQIFYVLGGTMNIEVDGRATEARAGTLIVFPAGIPHRNWNGGSEPTIHLAINAPLPAVDSIFARPVGDDQADPAT